MKILKTESTSIDQDASAQKEVLLLELKKLDKLYNVYKEAFAILQNMEMTATYGVTLPDITFVDPQGDPLDGVLPDEPTAEDVEYLVSVNNKLRKVLGTIRSQA